jgi:ABC-type multidrug transport system fused ATPase/permease subunit
MLHMRIFTLAFFVVHGVGGNSANNETCAVGDIRPECTGIAAELDGSSLDSFPLRLLWPPSTSTLPNLILVALVVWVVVALAMLNKETETEKEYQNKRAQQVLAQLSQTKYEHEQSSKKWDSYNERKSAMRKIADERVAKIKEDNPEFNDADDSVYQQVIIETGFATQEPPEAALDPKRVYEVLIDEVNDGPVIEISGIAEKLGPEKYKDLREYYSVVCGILVERVLDKLGKIFTKTEKALENEKDPRFKPYASGVKLAEIIELSKNIQRQFYPKRFFGMIQADVKDPEAAKFLKKLKEAKTLLREIRKKQPSRFIQILGFFHIQTFAYLAGAMVTRVFGGSIGPARGFLFNQVVVSASLENWQEPVTYNLLCIGVIFFFDWYVNDWLSMVATTKASSLLKHALRTKLFEAVMRQDTEYFDANDSSAIQDRVKGDCDNVCDNAIFIPMDIVGIVSSMAWNIALMYAYCPSMLPRTIATGLIIAPVFIGLNRLTREIRKKDDRTIRVIRSQTDEMLQKVKAVREFSREEQEAKDLDRGERVQMQSMILLRVMDHIQHMLIFTFLFGGEVSNYWYGARLVHQQELNPVKLIQIGGLVYHITFMFRHLMEQVPRLMRMMIPLSRIFELLESKSLIEPMPGDIKAAFQRKKGGVELELRDVTFSYPSMPEVTVLRHCSLKIPAGKTVAICGERAAGKSTLYCLMQRLYDVEYGKGEIIVNDHPLSHWDVRSYRRAISILAQKGLLFKGTIKENILYGLNEAEKRARNFHLPEGDAELQRLLELSGAWDIVKEFPLKMEQRIGTGGVALSGGTEQCLYISRGLVKKPAFLMMDEATSAMDTHTQKRAAEGIAAEQKKNRFLNCASCTPN